MIKLIVAWFTILFFPLIFWLFLNYITSLSGWFLIPYYIVWIGLIIVIIKANL
jgi:hypothetical protein